MRRARRADAGQADIVKALRAAGCSVEVLSDVGRGVPDLLAGRAMVNYLLEVKEPRGTLTDDQMKWRLKWRGIAHTVESADEALRVVGAVK